MGTTELELRLLGSPEIVAGGERLDFATRKTLALLVYLAVEEGVHGRDFLAALFWPENERARANLRNILNYLRQALPQTSAGDTPHLLIDRDTLAFNREAPHRLDVDVLAEATAKDAQGAKLERLQAAVAAYRGDFLEGFGLDGAPAFDDWVTLQREAAQRQFDRLCDRLSQRQLATGQVDAAARTVRRWLQHAPLQEAAYQRQMRIDLARGDRAGALQTYERCVRMLAESLAVEPAPATVALRARAEGPPSPTAGAPPVRPAGTQEADGPAFNQGPLVGREGTFSTLVERYQLAAGGSLIGRRGRPQVVVITGEAGIGKSRLAAEFAAWASAQGGDVLAGRSFESGRGLPYQAMVEALRPRLEKENAPEDLLDDVWLAALGQLLPELLERYPDLAQPAGATTQQAGDRAGRLFEAVARLGLSLAERLTRGALVLWLDDLQWSDEATFDLLYYCCRRWQAEPVPVLVLLGVRSEALHAATNPALVNFLGGLERELPLVRLPLAPLPAEATARFVDAFLEDGAASGERRQAFSQWLQAETGGQPFYLVETLQELAAQGLWPATTEANLPVLTAGSAPVPARVQRLLSARIGRLSPAAFELLMAATVLAHDFSFELLCGVASVEEEEGLRALDELLQQHLLREADAGGEGAVAANATYIFAHDKIRDVAHAEAGAARRCVFHRWALTALTERGAPPARLARHALQAGAQADAFRHSLAAGDAALRLYAAREAIGHCEQAEALLDAVDEAPIDQLYLQWGRAHEMAGDYDAALAVYDRLQTLAQELGDQPLQLAALMARTTVYAAPTQHYDPESVGRLTEEALPLAQALADHAAEAKIRWNLMLLHLFTGELAEAVAQGERSLEIALHHELPEQVAYAYHDLTRAYLFSGQPEEAVVAGQAAEQLWRELGNQAMLADMLVTTSSMMALSGELKQALPQLQEALALSRRIDNLWNQSYAQHILGMIYFELGQLDECREANERAIEAGRVAGFMLAPIVNGALMGLLYATLGRPEKALPWVEQALADAEQMHERQTAGPLAALAHIHLYLGALDKAEKLVARALARLDLQELSLSAILVLPTAAELALVRGEYGQALAFCDRFLAYMKQRKLVPFTLDAQITRAQALLAQGERAEARALLLAAREKARASGMRRGLMAVLAALAELETGEEAARYRVEGAALAEAVSASIADDALRRAFRERAPVAKLLGAAE